MKVSILILWLGYDFIQEVQFILYELQIYAAQRYSALLAPKTFTVSYNSRCTLSIELINYPLLSENLVKAIHIFYI